MTLERGSAPRAPSVPRRPTGPERRRSSSREVTVAESTDPLHDRDFIRAHRHILDRAHHRLGDARCGVTKDATSAEPSDHPRSVRCPPAHQHIGGSTTLVVQLRRGPPRCAHRSALRRLSPDRGHRARQPPVRGVHPLAQPLPLRGDGVGPRNTASTARPPYATARPTFTSSPNAATRSTSSRTSGSPTGQLASIHIGRSRRVPMGKIRRYIRELLQREHGG